MDVFREKGLFFLEAFFPLPFFCFSFGVTAWKTTFSTHFYNSEFNFSTHNHHHIHTKKRYHKLNYEIKLYFKKKC